MSVQALSAVLDHSEARLSTRLVAISLANHADKNGITFPSIRLAAEEALVGARTAKEAIDALREMGELVVLVEADGETHRPRLYWINLPGLSGELDESHAYFQAFGPPANFAPPPGADTAGGPPANFAPPGCEIEQEDGGFRTPPVRNTTRPLLEEPSVNRQSTEQQTVDPVEEIFEFWKSATGRNGSTRLTPNRRAAIKARLDEGRDVPFIKQAIANAADSPFHQGKNDRKTRYDDLTLICRNGEKLEQFGEMGGGSTGRTAAPSSPQGSGPIASTLEATQAWEATKAELADLVERSAFDLYIDPLEVAGERDGRLVLFDISDRAAGWVNRRYRPLILATLEDFTDFEIVAKSQLEPQAA